MEEQTQNSVNLEIPSRWRRFSAYLLDLIINIILWGIIPYILFIFTDGSIASVIIGLILLTLEIVFIIYERNTTGNELMGIVALNKENNWISKGQSILRNFVFNPAFLPLFLFFIWLGTLLVHYTYNLACDLCDDVYEESFIYSSFIYNIVELLSKISRGIVFIGLVLLFLNIIELFFKCPTFIDKWLGIKRFYKKSKKDNE